MATKIKRIFQKGSLFNITNETTGEAVTEASLVSIGDILDILTMDADKVPHIYGGCAEVISTSGFNTKIKVKDETNFIIGYKDKNKPLPYLKITNNANVDLYKADGTKITDTTELYVNDVIKVKPKDLNYFAGADVEALDDNSYITWVNPPEDDSSEECTFRANVQEITLIEKEVERLQRFIVSSDFESEADIHCTHLRYNKEIPVGTIYTMLCKGDRFQLTFKDGFYIDMSDADKGFELVDAENHIFKAIRIGRVYIDVKFKGKNVTLKVPNTTKCKVIKIDSEEVIPNDTVMKTGDKFRVIMTDARYYLKIPDNTTMNESGPWKYDELDGQRYFVCQIKNIPIDTVTIPDMPEKPTLNLDMREPADRDKIKSVTSIYGPTTSTLPSNIFHAGEPFKVELKDEYKNDYIITAKNERGFTIPSDGATNFKIDLRYDPQIVLKLESNTTKVKITNIRDGSDLVNGSILKRGDKFTVELPTFKKYINITFSDSIGVYHTYSSTKVTYIVKDDATKAEIKIEEAPIAHFDNKAHDIIKIFAMERTPQVEITTFPDDILHVGEQFRIVWKNPSDFIKYEIVYTNIEKTGEVAYKPTAVGAILDIIPMLHFTVVGYWSDIEFFNETTGKAISNMEQVHKGDIIKITLPHKYGTITPNEDLEVLSDTELVKRYKIKDTSSATPTVTLEETPKAHFNNLSPEILYVKAIDRTPAELITTFPEDILYVGENIEIGFKDTANESKYVIKPTTHLELVEGKKYKIKSAGGGVEAKKKATLHIIKSSTTSTEEECTVINAYDTSTTYHDGDTVCYSDTFRINLNETGYVLDSDKIKDLQENSGYFIVNGDNPTIATKLKAGNLHIDQQGRELCHVYKEDQVTELHESDSIYKGDIIYVVRTKEQYKISSTSGLEEQPGSAGLSHKFKITDVQNTYVSLNDEGYTTIDSDHPELIHVIDVMTNEVLTLPDSTTYKNNENWHRTFKIQLKHGLNPSDYPITIDGAEDDYEGYRITSFDKVMIHVETPKPTLHVLKSTPSATEAECTIFNPKDSTIHYEEGTKLELNTQICIYVEDGFLLDTDRLVDLEFVENVGDTTTYKITGFNPTVATKEAPAVTVNNENPDKIEIQTTKYPQVTLSTYPDTTHIKLNSQITMFIKDGFTTTHKIEFTGLKDYHYNRRYKVEAMTVNVKAVPKKPQVHIKLSGDLMSTLVYNEATDRTIHDNDLVQEGDVILLRFRNNFVKVTEISGLDLVSKNRYIVREDATEVKITLAEAPKAHVTVNATCGIDEHEIDIYKSTSPSETPIDFSTNPAFDLNSNLYVKLHKYVKMDMTNSEGIEFVKEEDGFAVYKLINTTAKFTTTLKDDVFEISITISKPGSVEIFRENETDTLESLDYIAKDEIVVVKVIDSKYVPTVDGLTQISHEGNTYKYKVTDSPTILIEDHTPIIINSNHPELIKVMDEYGVVELTLPDSSTYNFSSLSHAIQVYLKDGLNPSYYTITVTGATEYGPNQYRFNEPLEENVLINVEIAKATLTIVSHETPSELKVTNVAGDTEYHNGDQIEIGTKIKIVTNSPYVVDKAQLVDLEAVDEANSSYKITGLNPKVEAIVSTTPSTFHIKGDKDGVIVKKHPSQQVVHDGDVLTVGDKLSIIKVNGFKLTDLEGLASTDPVNNIYTVTGTESSVTCTLNPAVTINNTTPDRIEIKNHLGVSLTSYPDSTTLHQGEDITIEFKPPYSDTDYEIKFSGLEHKSGSNYQVKEDATEVKVYVSWKSIQLTITGKSSAVNVQSNGNLISNDYIFTAGEKFVVTRSNTFVSYTVTGADKFTSAEDTELKQTYIVREDVTAVAINVEEAQLVEIDCDTPDIISIKTVDLPIVTIDSFPNSDILHHNQDFLVEWKDPDYVNHYKIRTTVQHKSGMLYTVNQFAPFSVDAKHKAKIHILDKEHTNVTNMSNDPIYDNDYSLAIGDKLKIQRPPYSYEYRVKSVVGAVQKLGYLYEITDTEVTIEVEPVPFVTINNDNPDIISVSYYDKGVRKSIDTFPCSDKIHQTQEIVIEYRDEDLYKPLYDINVTGATATPSEHRYRVGTTDVNISAVMKVVPSHIKIKHAANVTVTAESDGREVHDGDTSISTTDVIKIVPKQFFKINSSLLKGLKATSDPNKFTIVATEVEVDVEEEPTVTLYNNKDSLLRVLVQDNEVTTFPSNLLHNEEIFKVIFRDTSLKDKYDMKVTGAELQASIPDGYSYKVSGSVVTIDCEHKKVPVTIHIPDETHVEVKTVENAVIHDGDTSLFIGDKIKIILKPGYKIKEPLVGLLKEGKEYKLIDENVTIEVEPRPYVTINNEAEALVKVSTSAEPPVEIVTFPSTADIREGETFLVEFRNATDENKYNIIVDGAMKLSDKRYQAVSSPVTIKTKNRPKVDPYLIKLRRSQGFGVRYIKWSRKGKLVHENSFF